MSGRNTARRQRYHGRGCGRGQSQAGGRSQASKLATKKPEKKTVDDYVYSIGTAKQINDFVIITKFLINHIKATYKFGANVGTALEAKQEFDFNSIKPSLEPLDPTITGRDNIKRA